jgi:hypothetical protein
LLAVSFIDWLDGLQRFPQVIISDHCCLALRIDAQDDPEEITVSFGNLVTRSRRYEYRTILLQTKDRSPTSLDAHKVGITSLRTTLTCRQLEIAVLASRWIAGR